MSLVLLYALLFRGAVADELEVQGRDSAAIAAAIQRCQPGDTLRLPAGTFELTESVRPKSGLKILGAGLDRTIFIYVGSESAPFVHLTGCEDVEIGRLTLDGRQRPLSQDGVRADNSRRLLLHDLAIRGLAKGKSAFVHGIIFSGNNPTMERGVTDSVIRDCRIDDVGVGAEFGGGIRLAWGSSRNRGAAIGLSVSNTPGKNNVFWGYNTIRDCVQWGAQFQGESGGIAHQYFYRCEFTGTVRGDPRARYLEASGHGFR